MIPELALSIMMAGGAVGEPHLSFESSEKVFAASYDPALEVYNKWGDLLADYFNEEDLYHISTIVWCESRGKETARNPKGSAAGLFQVLKSTAEWVLPNLGYTTRHETIKSGLRFNPEINVRIGAYLFYRGGGSKHWNESKRCWK